MSSVAGPLPQPDDLGLGFYREQAHAHFPIDKALQEAAKGTQAESIDPSKAPAIAEGRVSPMAVGSVPESPITRGQQDLAERVNKIALDIVASLQRTQTGEFKLAKLGQTQNPVAHIEEPFFVSEASLSDVAAAKGPAKPSMLVIREAIGQVLPQEYAVIDQELSEKLSKLPVQESHQAAALKAEAGRQKGMAKETLLKWVGETFGECQQAAGNDDAEVLAQFKSQTASMGRKKMAARGIKLLNEALNVPALQIKTEGAPRFYQKKQVLTFLHAQHLKAPEGSTYRKAFAEVISEVEQSDEEYFREDALQLTESQQKGLGDTLTPFYHSYDVMGLNDYKPVVAAFLKQTPEAKGSSRGPGFAVKSGIENQREVLAQNLNKALNLTTALLPKVPQPLPKASIQSTSLVDALVSLWLEGGTEMRESEWQPYLQAKKNLAIKKGTPAEEEARAVFNERAQAVLNVDGGNREMMAKERASLQIQLKALGNQFPRTREEKQLKREKSSQLQDRIEELDLLIPQMEVKTADAIDLAIVDLDLTSYDSHIHQVKFVDGEPQNYDFSRFLLPGIAMEDRQGETRAFLRSDLMDHPAVFEREIPEVLVEKWAKLTPEVIERQVADSGLLGTEEEFSDSLGKISHLFDLQEELYGADDSRISEINQELGLSTSSSHELNRELNTRISEIQRQSYQKIHPQAMGAWLIKAQRRVDYLGQPGPKTVQGLRDAMYPEFSPFIQVVEKETGNPGTRLAYTRDSGQIQLRSLEQIIRDAEKATAEGNPYASDQEIQAMKQALKDLKHSEGPLRGSYLDLPLTIDLTE